MTSSWKPPLPDTSTWGPTNAEAKIGALFHQRCRAAERRMVLQARIERETNEYNYDSGSGVEDIVRSELRAILPSRYGVHAGSISNSRGASAGDCDIVVFNDQWFPSVKPPATAQSRRVHYPVEGVYGVLEVKQTLTASALDDAMKKLVGVSRLELEVETERVVENRIDPELAKESAQPIFSAIIAVSLAPNEDFEELVHRFVAINGMLRRRDLVTALCVLGVGFVTWVYDVDGEAITNYFRDGESDRSLSPMLVRASDPDHDSAFYELVTVLMGYLGGQVLVADDLAVKYGAPQKGSRPQGSQWDMHPDVCECALHRV